MTEAQGVQFIQQAADTNTRLEAVGVMTGKVVVQLTVITIALVIIIFFQAMRRFR